LGFDVGKVVPGVSKDYVAITFKSKTVQKDKLDFLVLEGEGT
jgi:hypothetical protein